MKRVIKTRKTNILVIIIGIVFACTACEDKNNDTVGGTNQSSTPNATDFNISGTGTFTHDGSAKTVTITAKEGKTSGAITIKYNGNTTAPSTVGTYTVTFDVAASTGWNAASGLSAGTLVISEAIVNQTPTAADFNISGTGTFTHDGTSKTVTVTAKEGKTSGAVTVKYNGNTTAPSAVGTYTVTFDVTAATGWNAVSGLSAGTLVIGDANVSKMIEAAIETAKAVRYDPISSSTAGNKYTSSNEIYGECGDFALHFVLGWNKNNPESTAYLYINNQPPGNPQGLYTPSNNQPPKLNRIYRQNKNWSDSYAFWPFSFETGKTWYESYTASWYAFLSANSLPNSDYKTYAFWASNSGKNWVFNSTVAYVDLTRFQDIQTNTHLGVNLTNQPHVWVRIIFANGDIYDVDPTYLDGGSSTYYIKIK